MITPVLIAFATLAGGAQPPSAAPPPADGLRTLEGYLSFVAQCRYADGAKAMLFHRFGSDTFVFTLRLGRDDNLIWRIRPRGADGFDLEPAPRAHEGHRLNEPAVRALLPFMLARDIRVARHGNFADALARTDVEPCPQPFPFVPIPR